jgi:transcriptional regulator with XRE-family HTH domain
VRTGRLFIWDVVRICFFSGGAEVLANLKAALAARKMTQFELAGELRISPSVLTHFVLGRRPVEPEMRARVGELLGVADLEWLFMEVRPRAAARPAAQPENEAPAAVPAGR